VSVTGISTGYISASITGTSTLSAAIAGVGAVLAAIAGSDAVLCTLLGDGAIECDIEGVGTIVCALTGAGEISASIFGLSEVSGTLIPFVSPGVAISGLSTVTATLLGSYAAVLQAVTAVSALVEVANSIPPPPQPDAQIALAATQTALRNVAVTLQKVSEGADVGFTPYVAAQAAMLSSMFAVQALMGMTTDRQTLNQLQLQYAQMSRAYSQLVRLNFWGTAPLQSVA
jgi:hypothetical protein